MSIQLNRLNQKIVECRKCKRLVLFREKVAKEKRKMFLNEKYWGKPVIGFGDWLDYNVITVNQFQELNISLISPSYYNSSSQEYIEIN